MDPVVEPAFQLLQRRPLRPATAVKRLAKHTEDRLTHHLEQTGQIRRIRLQSKRFTHPYAWPLTNRGRVGQARSALLAALFDRRPPTPSTAAIITLLHAADGLGALLSLNDRGWRWVHARAGEIASGSWVDEYPTGAAGSEPCGHRVGGAAGAKLAPAPDRRAGPPNPRCRPTGAPDHRAPPTANPPSRRASSRRDARSATPPRPAIRRE